MILIVEDNKDVNHVLKEALEQAGYPSESAYDGLTALDLLKNATRHYVTVPEWRQYPEGA